MDRSGMLKLVEGFPDQCRKALEIAEAFAPVPAAVQNVVVLGMGGSAVGGDLLRVLLEAESGAVPVVVTRDYQCPAFVGPQTLCVAASYSGGTEETLAATHDALARGARLLPITTGGALAALAEERQISCVRIPGGQPPRSALGYLFLPAIVALSRMGLCRDFSADIRESIERLDEVAAACGSEVALDQNEAVQIARRLRRSLPVFYGSSPVTGIAAFRWKCQFNENAKMHAIWNNLPELDHNEICGWRSARQNRRLRWVFIRDRQESPRLAQRLEITRSILAAETAGHTDIWGQGASLLSRTLTAMLLGDFVSTYAAILNRVDPTDIREIDVLKEELSR